jgi:hypothetical protein
MAVPAIADWTAPQGSRFSPVSASIRRARRSCREAGGRRRLVGQNTKLSTTGRNVSFWLILAVPLETGPAGDVTKNSQWLDCCCTKMKG